MSFLLGLVLVDRLKCSNVFQLRDVIDIVTIDCIYTAATAHKKKTKKTISKYSRLIDKEMYSIYN